MTKLRQFTCVFFFSFFWAFFLGSSFLSFLGLRYFQVPPAFYLGDDQHAPRSPCSTIPGREKTTLALTRLPRLNMPVSNCFELLNHAQLRGWRGIAQKKHCNTLKWNSTVRDWVRGSTIHFMIHYMKYVTVKRFLKMADTADKNEACISCCKCSLEYLSTACNRTPLCVDWGRNGWVAYGACHSIALWLPKVRSLNTVLMYVVSLFHVH